MRMRLLAILALLTFAVPTAGAQQGERRSGLWLGVGGGAAWGEATCSVCSGQQSGPALHVTLGGTMSPALLPAVEVTGWVKQGSQVDRSFYVVTALATVYPSAELGLYLKAGLGGYTYAQEDAASELTSQGAAVQLGAGYDIPVAAAFPLSPFVAWATSGSGNPKRLDKASGLKLPLISDMKVQFFQVGLGVTIH